MKRIFSCFLAVLVVSLLAGCGSSQAEAPETEPKEREISEKIRETVPEVTENPKGELFLTVEKITFSVVGEQEDIYAGSVPADQVIWTSQDPQVIQVDQGVLTAVSVGETKITASFGDQEISCTAGCLAENEEELQKLDSSVLQQPKRLPSDTDDSCLQMIENAALVGDSISFGLLNWETQTGNLGHPLFLVRGGISIFGLIHQDRLLFYQGKLTTLEDAVANSGVQAIYVLLGQNDLGFSDLQTTLSNLDLLMSRVREKSPEVRIYLQSCFPEKNENSALNSHNEKLREFNRSLKPYAEEKGYYYMDVAAYIENHLGSMANSYSLDEIHLNEQGCLAWMAGLRTGMQALRLKENSVKS